MATPPAAAASLCRRWRNVAMHSRYNLPPLSLMLTMVPGSGPGNGVNSSQVDFSLDGDTFSAPQQRWEEGTSAFTPVLPTPSTALHQAAWRAKDPQQWDSGTSVFTPALPNPRITLHQAKDPQQLESSSSEFTLALPTPGNALHQAAWRARDPQQWEAGSSAFTPALPTPRTAFHQAAWRAKDPFHQGWGARRCFSTQPFPVRAIFSEIGSYHYALDPTDRWIRFDEYMAKNLAFQLIQGHSMILDSDLAMMWERGPRKVLENMYWLVHYNRLHKVCIAAALKPENLLVAEKSFSIKLINPDAEIIDGIDHAESDGLKAATNLYVGEVLKNQPHVVLSLDFAHLVKKVDGLTPSMTKDEEESVLYDASLLDDAGITAATHQASFLLRGAYITSGDKADTTIREDTLIDVEKLPCSDGTVWQTYMKKVPISNYFYQECMIRSKVHRLRYSSNPRFMQV